MKHRRLRIAWSVAWGVVAVLLIALWVRSFWYADDLGRYQNGSLYLIESACGSLRPVYSSDEGPGAFWVYSCELLAYTNSYEHPIFGLDSKDFPLYFQAYVPHWLLAIAFAVCAVVPWLHWSSRFSLRTLLIATTLVAVGLGAIAWLIH
jgi:hypothetical protein